MIHGQTDTVQNDTLASALATLKQDDKGWPTSLTIQQAEALLVDRERMKVEIGELKVENELLYTPQRLEYLGHGCYVNLSTGWLEIPAVGEEE